MSSTVLSAAARKQLRSLAHDLEPIVRIGHAGVTDGVVAATTQALLDHELIKARLYEPEDKTGMAAELAKRCDATLCGLVGHTAILYRPHPVNPKIEIGGAVGAGKKAVSAGKKAVYAGKKPRAGAR
jgi:RNA-binding protein